MKVDRVWNVMAHAQKPHFVFRRNGRVHLNRRGRQFSRLLAAEVCASAVVMLDTPCSEVVWRVLATHSTRQFPLNFPSRASPCANTFQLDSTPLDSEEGRVLGSELLAVCGRGEKVERLGWRWCSVGGILRQFEFLYFKMFVVFQDVLCVLLLVFSCVLL